MHHERQLSHSAVPLGICVREREGGDSGRSEQREREGGEKEREKDECGEGKRVSERGSPGRLGGEGQAPFARDQPDAPAA
jgi:type IV secretory pathway VirD2 relaxase